MTEAKPQPLLGLSAKVVIASTRAAAGEYQDLTGPKLRKWLMGLGFEVPEPFVVADGTPVGKKLQELLNEAPNLIITSGGTGISPTDKTPEQTLPLLEVQIPGIIEAIRARGLQSTDFAALSRGYAGFANETLIINLPGSMGSVKDSVAILSKLLPHIFDQRAGGGP